MTRLKKECGKIWEDVENMSETKKVDSKNGESEAKYVSLNKHLASKVNKSQ